MKRKAWKRACLLLLVTVALARELRADDWDDLWRGGLIGGALGALVSRNDGIDADSAVPAFALTGALIGYGADHGWFSHRYDDDFYLTYGLPYRYHHPYRGYHAYRPYHRRHVRVADARAEASLPPDSDLHPGITIERIPVTLDNGVTINVRVLRLGEGRYVGPRGTSFDAKPTGEQLKTLL